MSRRLYLVCDFGHLVLCYELEFHPPHYGCLTLRYHSPGALVSTGVLALLTLRQVLLAGWAHFPLAFNSPCLLSFDITPSHGILLAGPTAVDLSSWNLSS